MKSYSFIELSSRELIQAFAQKHSLGEEFGNKYVHPQEDYLLKSETRSIFVVADGVTLNHRVLRERNEDYPNPSPAGEVAKLFCEGVIEEGDNVYDTLSSESIQGMFNAGNQKVSVYNSEFGATDYSGNITGKFAATGSFMVVKDQMVFWATICDAFFAHFDTDMNLKHMSSGSCIPYAVINGEVGMVDFIETGTSKVSSGDKLFIFTDGFEHYMKNEDFQNLFKAINDSMYDQVEAFSKDHNEADPDTYGHERSLIVVEC